MFVGIGVGIGRNRFAQGIFNAYNLRVVADGGITEAGNCVNAVSSLLQSASLLLIPSGYKGGKLYAEIPTNGNGDLTWTRGSDAFRTNASGVLQRVPWNLFTYSSEFDNVAWGKNGLSITPNSTIAPDGTTTADLLDEGTLNTQHWIWENPTFNLNTTYTISVYAKYVSRQYISINIYNGVSSNYIFYDIQNGSIIGSTGDVTATITSVGNGWYRITYARTISSSGSPNMRIAMSDTVGNVFYTGTNKQVYLWGAQLVEGTTAQTYLPTTDRLNFPRLSYMYGSCPSALLEPQRTNAALYSEQFDNASWTKGNTTVTANSTTAPDGTNTADTLTDNSTSSTHNLDIGGLVGVYTFSVYAKKGTSNYVGLYSSSALQGVYWNLDTGAFSANINVAPTSSSITSVGNGWYRCSISVTTTSTATFRVLMSNNGSSFIYAGTGQTIYLWGAQLELGAYPTTYIQTTSATATRVADSFSRNNIYTNGLISASGGTWFVELRGNVAYKGDASGDGVFLQTTGNTDNLRLYSENGFSQRIAVYKRVSGTNALLYVTTTDTTKIAIKWNGSTADVFANGTKVVSATSFTATQLQELTTSISSAPKFIQQMALFPTPLSDTDCTTLTT